MSYVKNMNIPVTGSKDYVLYTKTGICLIYAYHRVVIGDRGPYIECDVTQMDWRHVIPAKDQWWRFDKKHEDNIFYLEFRTEYDCNVKIYQQLKRVTYADYKPGMFYVSPFDLTLANRRTPVMEDMSYD